MSRKILRPQTSDRAPISGADRKLRKPLTPITTPFMIRASSWNVLSKRRSDWLLSYLEGGVEDVDHGGRDEAPGEELKEDGHHGMADGGCARCTASHDQVERDHLLSYCTEVIPGLEVRTNCSVMWTVVQRMVVVSIFNISTCSLAGGVSWRVVSEEL